MRLKHKIVEHHETHLKHIATGAHMGYFSLVVFHGPYDIMAGVCLFIGLVMWLLGIEH